MTPKPFTLEVPEADIEDLKTRLARTRFPAQAPDAPWAYGTDLGLVARSVQLARAGGETERVSAIHGAPAWYRRTFH